MDLGVEEQLRGAASSSQGFVAEMPWWRNISVERTPLPLNQGLETTSMIRNMRSVPPGFQPKGIQVPPPLLDLEQSYERAQHLTEEGIRTLHSQTCSMYPDSNSIVRSVYGVNFGASNTRSNILSNFRSTESGTLGVCLKNMPTGVVVWTHNERRSYLASWKITAALENLLSDVNLFLGRLKGPDMSFATFPFIASFILRFLAIHPFENGNGRVATLLQLFLTKRALGFYVPHIPGDCLIRGYLYQSSQFAAGRLLPLDGITTSFLEVYLVDCAYTAFKNVARNETRVLIITGTPGSGKTCLTQCLCYLFHSVDKRFNVINLDPDVTSLPYECNIDIRTAVDFHALMDHSKSGSSGTTLAALDMFASVAGEVLVQLKENAHALQYILVDAPAGFAESQAGITLLHNLGANFITDVLFLIDTPSATQPIPFITSMMKVWLVQHNIERLPLTLVFNKVDVGNPRDPVEWMRNDVLANGQDISLQQMHSALKSCYKSVGLAAVSAKTGAGASDLLEALGDCSGSEAVRAAVVSGGNKGAGHVLSSMKQFSFNEALKEILSEEKIVELKEIFRRLDTRNSGTITSDELKAGLANLGAETDVQQLMQTLGVDGNGSIDYSDVMHSEFHKENIHQDSDFGHWKIIHSMSEFP